MEIKYAIENINNCKSAENFICSEIYRVANMKILSYFSSYSEDIIQEVVIKILQVLREDKYIYKSDNHFYKYLSNTTRNTFIDLKRKLKVELNNNKSYLNEFLFNIREDYSNSELNSLRYKRLMNIVDTLPISQREAIKMYYLNEYTHIVIAERCNISENTSKTNLYKAKNKIINKYKELYG